MKRMHDDAIKKFEDKTKVGCIGCFHKLTVVSDHLF